MTPEEVIATRQKTHGDYATMARICLATLDVWMASPNWSTLTPVHKQSLIENAHKVARILSGDPNEPDHWRDIAGYAQLVTNSLQASLKNSKAESINGDRPHIIVDDRLFYDEIDAKELDHLPREYQLQYKWSNDLKAYIRQDGKFIGGRFFPLIIEGNELLDWARRLHDSGVKYEFNIKRQLYVLRS